jgi:hypothetical protein
MTVGVLLLVMYNKYRFFAIFTHTVTPKKVCCVLLREDVRQNRRGGAMVTRGKMYKRSFTETVQSI